MGGDIENIVWPLKYMNFLDISVILVAQIVKNLPAMLETWVLSLGQEDPLEKGILQDSCLENSIDRGAWWIIVYGVTKSLTQLSD